MKSKSLGERLQDLLVRTWWLPRRNWLAWCLWPASLLYDVLRRAVRRQATPWHAPCPVVVVGNLVIGGAGKTPTVIALVQGLRAQGYTPGVVSRGYGRRLAGVRHVEDASRSTEVGDEPLLIQRATLAPVVVGERRVDAAQALLQAHPDVDVLVSDDGLQHAALASDLELWVFDERGAGNGMLLPAGPLRQPLPATVPAHALVLYNAIEPTTRLPGPCAIRTLAGALDWHAWRAGGAMQPETLRALQGRRVAAVAGIGAPARFFAMLREAGLTIDEYPLADHARFDTAPWPVAATDVVCTEKDAVKLDPKLIGKTPVWVVGLDFRLPVHLLDAVRARIAPPIRS